VWIRARVNVVSECMLRACVRAWMCGGDCVNVCRVYVHVCVCVCVCVRYFSAIELESQLT